MQIFVWWLLPVLTTLLAGAWAAWVRRTPRAPSDADTIDGYARFRAVLAATSADAAGTVVVPPALDSYSTVEPTPAGAHGDGAGNASTR